MWKRAPLVRRPMMVAPLFRIMDEGSTGVEKVQGCPDMENGSAVVKPLVTRTSDGVEDDTFFKRLEEGAPVVEEGVSGTEESASGTEEGAYGTEESALLCSRVSWWRAPGVE